MASLSALLAQQMPLLSVLRFLVSRLHCTLIIDIKTEEVNAPLITLAARVNEF